MKGSSFSERLNWSENWDADQEQRPKGQCEIEVDLNTFHT